MNIETMLLKVVFPIALAIAGAAIGFLFRRLDKLNTLSITHEEKIKNLENRYDNLKEWMHRMEKEIKELPDKIFVRIKEILPK